MGDGAGLGVWGPRMILRRDESSGQGMKRKLPSWGMGGEVGVRSDSAEVGLLV